MKLYVGNIPFNLSSQDIRSIFSDFGKIESADVIYDHATWTLARVCVRPHGFG